MHVGKTILVTGNQILCVADSLPVVHTIDDLNLLEKDAMARFALPFWFRVRGDVGIGCNLRQGCMYLRIFLIGY